jgi:hypothetical protein
MSFFLPVWVGSCLEIILLIAGALIGNLHHVLHG